MRDPRRDPLEPAGLPPGIGVVEEAWTLVEQVRVLGPAVTGAERRVRAPGARWRARLGLEARQADLELWRAWLARHDGGLAPALLGPMLGRLPARGAESGPQAPFSDGTGHDDGSGLSAGGGRALTRGVARRGSRRLRLEGAGLAGRVRTGQFLSFRARLHVIRQAGPAGADAVDLRVWPPLAADLANGTRPDLRPLCRMRLSDPDAGEAAAAGRRMRVRWRVEFLETPPQGPLAAPLAAMSERWR